MNLTKGEWKAKFHRVIIHHPKWSDDSKVIAICNEWLDETKDNVRLIAAAPDMYEALKALIEHMTMNKNELGRPYLADVKRMADKALAKVEGKGGDSSKQED